MRLLGPGDEVLSEGGTAPAIADISARFHDLDAPDDLGLGHPAVMFRADRYRACGGYRAAFRVAQDVDLWLRLSEHGRILREGCVRTEIRIGLDALTPRYHGLQIRLRELAVAAARARRRGEDESSVLAEAEAECRRDMSRTRRPRRWQAAYFVAACLERQRQFDKAAGYYRAAIERSPLAPRPRLRLLRLALRARWPWTA